MPTVLPTMKASWMGVLNTRWSPKSRARVAASRNTPPSLPPTSCPYSSTRGSSCISSRMAKRAQSTITVGSRSFGARSPASSVIGVGANMCVVRSSGVGSAALRASSKSAFTRAMAFFSTSFRPSCLKPWSSRYWKKRG